ncbi:MAG: hypothetical protein K0U78_17025 [Actinomycetia bacterium]|nr:hypothetical protein [Actinomycetes bacterium]
MPVPAFLARLLATDIGKRPGGGLVVLLGAWRRVSEARAGPLHVRQGDPAVDGFLV